MFICIGLSSVYANLTNAQTKIDINVTGVTLEELFKEIQNKSEFVFFYKDDVLNSKKKISINLKNVSLAAILDNAFLNTDLDYKIDDRQVVVKKKIVSVEAATVLNHTKFQGFSVSGIITDNTGAPLPGASIVEKGTTNGTQTDFEGNFSITVEREGAILTISYIGFTTMEVAASGQTNLNVQLEESTAGLDEVIVTAQGLKRGKKAVGYAVQQVTSEDIVDSGATSVVDALVGKAAGIQITRSSGSPGGGSRIVVRGVTSMLGDNQPLIVIDGVRTNNETINNGVDNAGVSQSNRLMDLNTEDIKSLTVLKGAAATALYGTAGSTGVIVIETKKGNIGESFSISFSSQTTIDRVTTLFPDQRVFAQGSGGVYRDPSTGASSSWGPKLDELEFSTDPNHPNAPETNAFNEGVYIYDKNGFLVPKGTGNGRPAKNYGSNLESFFQTAISTLHSLNIEGGGKSASYRFSTSYLDSKGVIPNESYDRLTLSLASDLRATDKLLFSTIFNYANSKHQKIQLGSNTSGVILGLFRSPISFDNTNGFGSRAVNEPSSYIFPDGSQRNYRGGGGYDNPYWTLNNTPANEDVNRFYGSFKADYKIDQWFNIGLNIGIDFTNDSRKQSFEINSRAFSTGRVTKSEFNSLFSDSYLNITGTGGLSENLELNYVIGANLFSYRRSGLDAVGSNLIFQGFLDLSNATAVTANENLTKYRTAGIFGQIELGYQKLVYLTLSGRNDWDSRLAGVGNDYKLSGISFFYPSVSSSIIFSEFLPKDGILSLGKLRASWAQVGAPPPLAYLTTTPFVSNSIGGAWDNALQFPIQGQTGFELDGVQGNMNLKPELSTTIEFGTDMRFFDGRFGIDATYYRTKTEDAILNASLPLSTGFSSIWLNSGVMESNGLEFVVDVTPIRTNNFNWNTNINFTKSKSIVKKLAPGLERLSLGGLGQGYSFLVEGEQYGAILGGAYLREGSGGPNDDGVNIPDGQILINDDSTSNEYGYQIADPVQRLIGNPNPDFIIGWRNGISYKNLGLNFLLDWKEGGDLWNGTAWAMTSLGRSTITGDTRLESPRPIPGILATSGQQNNIPIVRDESYWTSSVGGFGAVGEQFVQDAGWVRLREIGVTYDLPQKLLADTFIKGARFSITGRNLWFVTDYDGVDPETSLRGPGNSQGLEYFNMPSSQSVVFKLSLNF